MDEQGNIIPDTKIELELPRLIEVADYHEFHGLQHFLQVDLGLKEVRVTEVGFDGRYIGLVHMDTESHNQLVCQIQEQYKEME
jgi:hypothetical protein